MKKSFRQYLTESIHTFNYKIKIAGEPSKNWLDLFVFNLQKFDPVKIGTPRSTPVQSEPYGFPGLKDQPITIIDCEFKYPATEPMIKQLARLQEYDENLVRMVQRDYDDSITHEAEQYANQAKHSPLLDHEKLEDSGKQANRDYADQYLSKIKSEAKKNKIDYAAPKTQTAFDPYNKKQSTESMGTASPMSTIKRPPKPATGSRKEGN